MVGDCLVFLDLKTFSLHINIDLQTKGCVFFSGIVRTALPNMDREMRDQYVLIIQAKDMVGQMGGLSGSTSVTVTLTDVNDNPPRFSRSKSTQCLSCLCLSC